MNTVLYSNWNIILLYFQLTFINFNSKTFRYKNSWYDSVIKLFAALVKICLAQRKAIATLQINTVGQIYNKVIIPLHFVHLLSELWEPRGSVRRGRVRSSLCLCVKGWNRKVEQVRRRGSVVQFATLTPSPSLYPSNDLPQHLCDTNFAQENKVIHSGMWGGGRFYEHAMHILIKWQAEWQTNCQPACYALAWPGWGLCLLCKYAGQIDSVGRRNCVSKVENKTRRMRNFNRKPPQMYANITRIRHVNNIHNRNLSPTRTLGENWKGISRAKEEEEELEEGT